MQPQNQNPYQQPQQPTPPVAPGPAPVAPPAASPPQPQQLPPQPVAQPVMSQPVQPAPAPAPASIQPQPTPPSQSQPSVADDPAATEVVFYEDEDGAYDEQFDLSEPVTWQAKEYVHHEKNSTWFVVFGIVMAVFMALAIIFMRSWTFAALLVVIGVVVIVLAKRPPRIMNYSLSDKGLHIGDTLHNFSDFRAFGVIHDGQEYSIMLIPTKRFLPGITVYFPEESGEEIVDALGSRLPMQELRLDIVDRIVRQLRLG